MRVAGTHFRTIWLAEDGWRVRVIDQRALPFRFEFVDLSGVEQAAFAIRDMIVRGAPLIGATAAYGVALAMRRDASDSHLSDAIALLGATRPTAVNLAWALRRMRSALENTEPALRAKCAYETAAKIADEDAAYCAAIGRHGLELLRPIAARKRGEPLQILTHCNAGWLACVDWGTALAPIYAAHDAGLAVHVYVDETRPRGQGASLTTFELASHGVPHTLICDNAGGHLMQHGLVDACVVGCDRLAANGDVANKIGTYLKALAALDNGVPFYAALPSSTIDWHVTDGVAQIPIEHRSASEVTHVRGMDKAGNLSEIAIVTAGTHAANPAFDVTPARLITGIITERGITSATRAGLLALYPERADIAPLPQAAS
jgi:methylthioribose-1-phosphate isomerase